MPRHWHNIHFFAANYDDATRTFPSAVEIGDDITALGNGQFTVTTDPEATPEEKVTFDPATIPNGFWFGYVAKDKLNVEPYGRLSLYNDLASVAEAKGNVANYESLANVAGCEKCHGTPYYKHGYRTAQVTGLNDFSSCKGCHYDTRDGGHATWQRIVSNPEGFANDDPLSAEETSTYAYKATVMNDVHMSHSMEFGYPQSMANCATCHEGNLDEILADDNFNPMTCKSCHAVNSTVDEAAGEENPLNRHAAPSLHSLWVEKNALQFHDITKPNCTVCHSVAGGAAPLFSELMPGLDPKIYDLNTGKKYSETITASIDTTAFAGNVLTIEFSATGSTSELSAADIVPTLEVGLYGYGTKDFLVGPHRRDVDDDRNLEVTFGSTNPRVKIESGAAAGSWVATADLSAWADKIADGAIERAEIGVLPQLQRDTGEVDSEGKPVMETVALNAPSRTFNLTTKNFEDDFFGGNNSDPTLNIANVDSCNKCHDALATTFHSANRGGNITVCRLCHESLSDSSHLEMQSRAIDNYAHAVHSFQAFDIEDYDFTDPVQEAAFIIHGEHFFPNFTLKNCEGCHNSGTYAVPNQAYSLPAYLSKSSEVTGMNRNIGDIPGYVTGPTSRSCAGCHRAIFDKEDALYALDPELGSKDAAGELITLNAHASQNGYLFEVSDDEDADNVLATVIERIMSFF